MKSINLKTKIGAKEFYYACKRMIFTDDFHHNIKTPNGVANYILSQIENQ